VEYLARQTAPAFTVVDTPRALLEALAANARTAVFLNRSGAPAAAAADVVVEGEVQVQGEAAEDSGEQMKKSSKRKSKANRGQSKAGEALDTFQTVARSFQARAEASPLAWVVANVSATAWGADDVADVQARLAVALGEHADVTAAGPVLVVKRGSATQSFAGPWRRKVERCRLNL